MANLNRKFDEQGIANEQFDETYRVIKALMYGYDGSSPVTIRVNTDGSISISKKDEAFALDDTTTADTVYLGFAPPGSATSASVWKIKKMDTSSGLVITFADGDSLYNNEWDERENLSYGS